MNQNDRRRKLAKSRTTKASLAEIRERSQRTTLVTARGKSLFVGTGVDTYSCSNCETPLIEGFDAREFPALSIRCAQCGTINDTENWPNDEPLPQFRLLFPPGNFAIERVATTGMCITTELEAKRILELQRPRIEVPSPRFGDPKAPGQLKAILNRFTSGEFATSLEYARGTRAKGDIRRKLPLEWALLEVDRMEATLSVNLDSDDVKALAIAHAAVEAVQKWRHHPRAGIILPALFGREFLHTIALLRFALFMFQHGHSQVVGFDDAAKFGSGQKIPDMYINSWPHSRISMEVKAPSRFHWPNLTNDRDEIFSIVKSKAQKAAKQLRDHGGGMVLFGAMTDNLEFPLQLDSVIEELARRGQFSRCILGVGAAVLNLNPIIEVRKSGDKSVYQEMRSIVHANPRYEGPHALNPATTVDLDHVLRNSLNQR